MLKKLFLAALLSLGFAAAAPQGSTAAPIGPAVTLSGELAPGMVQQTQWRHRRRGYRRGFSRRGFSRPRFYRRGFYRPRFYGRRSYRRGYYAPRRFYRPRYSYRRRFF